MREIQYKTEKHDHEKILKCFKNYIDYYKKKYKHLNKKKVILIITESLTRSASTISSGTLAELNPSMNVVILASTTLWSSIAILITNEHIWKYKIWYTKLRDWIFVTTFLYEKTMKTSMVDKKTDDKKELELKNIYKIITLIKEKKGSNEEYSIQSWRYSRWYNN